MIEQVKEIISDLLKDRDRLWDIATQAAEDKSSLVKEVDRLRAENAELRSKLHPHNKPWDEEGKG